MFKGQWNVRDSSRQGRKNIEKTGKSEEDSGDFLSCKAITGDLKDESHG